MSALQKLEQAMRLMKDAQKLISEAVADNSSLENYYGYSLEIIRKQLTKYSDNASGYLMHHNTPLSDIIEAEGANWKTEPGAPVSADKVQQGGEHSYFPDTLRRWIAQTLSSDMTSTNSELVKAFIEKGIDRNVARRLIAGEREKCTQHGGAHQINFDDYEPVDDRIFTAADMHEFAWEVAQEAMGAAFNGSKSIKGMPLADYIAASLGDMGGDDSYETWVPRKQWPSQEPTEGNPTIQPRKKAPLKKNPKKPKR